MQGVERWLFKARSDIKTSRVLLASGIFDTAMYHTQQCAEKALKGYLDCRNAPLEKTHDLGVLTKKCIEFDSSFSILLVRATQLKPFATKFRYPDDVLEPEKEDVEHAIQYAQEILTFVEDKINEFEQGQKNIF